MRPILDGVRAGTILKAFVAVFPTYEHAGLPENVFANWDNTSGADVVSSTDMVASKEHWGLIIS